MSTWVYVFDEFKPVDIDTGKLFEIAEKDPLKLLEIIKEALVDHVKEIKDVKSMISILILTVSNFS